MIGTNLENPWESLDFGPEENTQCDVDVLKILAWRGDRDVAGLAAHVVDDGALNDGDHEVCSLLSHNLRHTTELVEDDSAMATVDCFQVK